MVDAGEQTARTAAEVETPSDFLANLSKALREKESWLDAALGSLVRDRRRGC